MSNFLTSWTAACRASLSFSTSQSLFKLMSTESAMPSNHLILCRPLLLLPSVFPSIRIFSRELASYIRQPKYWSFNFSIGASSENQGWFPLGLIGLIPLLPEGLNSLLQQHNLKTSVLCLLAFFMVQFSCPYMTTGKTIALTRWTLPAKWCICLLIPCLGLS